MKKLHFILPVVLSGLAISCKKDLDFIETAPQNKTSAAVTATLAVGTVYYVSASGNDNNSGTSSTAAWKTIAKVNAKKFVAGDQVLFEGGKTFAGNLKISSSGASGNYIKFSSYGTGRAIISAGSGNGIYVYNNSFIWITNIAVAGAWNAGAQAGNTGTGIYFYNDLPGAVKLGTVFISYCDVYGFKNAGIYVLGYPSDLSQSGYDNVNLSFNTVHDNGDAGITTVGPAAGAGSTAYAFSNVYVANNKVYNNLGVKSITNSHSGDGILIGGAAAGTIEKNVAYNNGWYNMTAAEGPAAIWCYDSKNLTFQFNEAHHNGTGSGKPDGDGFDLDGGAVNCIMQYNYSHDNYGAGFLLWEYGNKRISNSKNIIRYNISQNDNTNAASYGGITMGPNCNNNLVYNNTFFSTKGSSVRLYGGSGNKFYNNIFYVAKSGAAVVTSSVKTCLFVNNNYYNPYGLKLAYAGSSYTTLAAFRATGNEILSGVNYGYNTDPALSSAGGGSSIDTGDPSALTSYTLKTGSAMINKGYNLSLQGITAGSFDFKKASIPYNGAYDIGACEFH